MGTIKQDIHDLGSALDFFAGYATQEVPADYMVGLQHAGWVRLADALTYARGQIGSRLQPTQIATLPAKHRAAAVLWFVDTLSNLKGNTLGRVWTTLQSYPVEQLADKFPNAGAINEWVSQGALPWGRPKEPSAPEPRLMLNNRFGVTEGAGLVLIAAVSQKISCTEARNLAAHLEIAAAHIDPQPTMAFEMFLKAARANLGHSPKAPEPKPGKPAAKKRRKAPKGDQHSS